MITRKVILSLCAAAIAWLTERPGLAQPVELRLLTHNVYGLNDLVCDQRAAAFGNIVAHAGAAYDVVGLQEYYDNPGPFTCDSQYLSDAIWCTGRYANSDQYYRFYPEGGVLSDGGIGIFTMGSICNFDDHQFAYQQFIEAVQGVIFARVVIPNSTVTLDVYVLHLHSAGDDCDRCCRLGELQEVAAYISINSQRSGNPVIVMGDFNIGGPPSCCGNPGYEDILTTLGNPIDMWLDKHPCGNEPINHCVAHVACDPLESECNCCAGAGSPAPPVGYCFDAEPYGCEPPACSDSGAVSTCSNGVCENSDARWAGYTFDSSINELSDGQYRIDFIFLLNDPTLSSNAFDVAVSDARVANFSGLFQPPIDCDACNEDCTDCEVPPSYIGHVSDHFGVEATIVVSGTPSVWVDSAQTTQGTGTSCDPFATVAAGVAAVPAGDRVLVRAGSYPELLTINQHLKLQAVGGAVTIGF